MYMDKNVEVFIAGVVLHHMAPIFVFCISYMDKNVGVFIAGVVLHHVAPIDAIFPAALHETRPRLLTAKERERKKEEKSRGKEKNEYAMLFPG